MTPYATLGGGRQPTVTLYHGDVLEVLRGLEVASVHCVVTSPPYWGLRDYGTGTWEGGDPGCVHRNRPPPFSAKALANSTIGVHANTNHATEGYLQRCGRCGARRVDQQLGRETFPFCESWERGPRCTQCWVCAMVGVFEQVKRVLRDDGVMFLNVGDAYTSSTQFNGHGGLGGGHRYQEQTADAWGGHRTAVQGLPAKNLLGLPWRLALALQAAGWCLRSEIIWAKKNCLPESVTDRPTKAHEQVFLLTKQPRYFYDADAVRQPYSGPMYGGVENGAILNGDRHDRGKTCGMSNPSGRNLRSVLSLASEPFPGAHFATMPTKLVEPCVLAGCPPGGVVLDPFCGSGTVNLVSVQHGRHSLGIDLSRSYLDLAIARLTPALAQLPLFAPTLAPRA